MVERARPQMLVFSYHKSGTTLFLRVMGAVAAALGLKLENHYGLVSSIDRGADIVLLPHSLVGCQLDMPFRAIRIVRDPRDIWVSGYLYHLRSNEEWCTNTNFDPTPPIVYPRVDFSVQHKLESWKQAYLAGLGGKSYQQNLLDRDREAGLQFELERYTGWTLDAMRGWRLGGPAVMDAKLETIVQDFDRTMLAIFRHLGLNDGECVTALHAARDQDIARMTDDEIVANPHIYSRDVSKWRAFLLPSQVTAFERWHADLITSLGYALSATDELSAVRQRSPVATPPTPLHTHRR